MTTSERDHVLERERRQTLGLGLLKGMGVTLKHLFKHNTVIQYPDEKQDLSARTRGVIALKEENCTVCMLCARECPDWCIYIDSHKETLPPKREGGRPRKRNVLDRFAIDYALCMYCGICVEVCPYDALFWSREFEYAEFDIRELTHEKERLSDWMATVLPPPSLEEGALLPGEPATAAGAAGPGSAQRPSPPSQATAAEERPQQAARAPEAAATPAPPEAKASAAQEQAGETAQASAATLPDVTEQRVEEHAGERRAEETARPTGTEGAQPEGLESAGERPPAEAEPPTQEAPVSSQGVEPAAAERPPVDADAVFRQVLQEQLDKGSSPQVAEARARVAKVRAERGVRDGAAGPAPSPSEPPSPEVFESAQPGAGEDAAPGEAAPAPQAEAAPESSAPPAAEASPEPPAEAPAPAGPPTPRAEAAPEDPDAAYERVLAEERAKGSSDAVAIARAKAARVRAIKGTKGPGG